MRAKSDDPDEGDQAPPPTLTPNDLQLQESMKKVFGNHLLREKILEHVIYTSDSKVNYADVPNVRLVEKSWLVSTSQVLRRNHDPLYNISTSVVDSQGEFLDVNEQEILNSFVDTIAQPERIENFIPPINLSLVCSFFVPENWEALSEFLVSCGPGLTALEMAIPKSCTLPFLFPRFSLLNLKKLSIKFVLHSHSNSNNDGNDPAEENFLRENTAVSYFIQQILNSTCKLEKLEFTASMWAESDLLPSGIDLIHLPNTVTSLLISCPFLAKHLEMMVPSDNKAIHANLTNVEIMASEIPFPQDTINRILSAHCGTLRELKLSGKEYQTMDVSLPSMFKMPHSMKKLEKITLASPSWLCVDKFRMDFIRNYPNLTTFEMEKVSLALFKQITDYRANLKSVKKLRVWLVSEEDALHHFETTITLDLESMQRAHLTFSCVCHLDITICGKEICGLKYIFKEMRQLVSLAINVQNVRENNMTCETWDGLFIGAPEAIAKGLRNHTDFWENFKLEADNNYLSIQNLTALSKLTLASSNMPIHYGILTGMKGCMISEVSFHYGFLKMPGLTNLELFGRFQPNELMINLWKDGKQPKDCLVYGEARSGGWPAT